MDDNDLYDDEELPDAVFASGFGPLEFEPLSYAGFVAVADLDPKTQMYVGLFAQGPPEGCVPWLN